MSSFKLCKVFKLARGARNQLSVVVYVDSILPRLLDQESH